MAKDLVADPGFTLEISMMDKLWIKKSLRLQYDSVKRSLAKEMPGTEIYDLRQRELLALTNLIARIA